MPTASNEGVWKPHGGIFSPPSWSVELAGIGTLPQRLQEFLLCPVLGAKAATELALKLENRLRLDLGLKSLDTPFWLDIPAWLTQASLLPPSAENYAVLESILGMELPLDETIERVMAAAACL